MTRRSPHPIAVQDRFDRRLTVVFGMADPQVMRGQAVLAGTRVPVSVILDCLAAGMTVEEITAEYPTVSVAGVRAAAAYGAALAREELLPLPTSQ